MNGRHTNSNNNKSTEIIPLVETLQKDNFKLRQELVHLKNQLDQQACTAPLLGEMNNPSTGISENLRNLINSLESELMEEKSKGSHLSHRYRQEVSQLRADLNASNASQRGLYRRIDQLVNELDVFKRGRCSTIMSRSRPQSVSLDRQLSIPKRTSSAASHGMFGHQSRRDTLGTHLSIPTYRSDSLRRPLSNDSRHLRRAGSASPNLCRPRAEVMDRSVRQSLASMTQVPYKNTNRPIRSAFSPARPRTCSSDRLSLANRQAYQRFNPTAYIHERKQRREEVTIQRHANLQRQLSVTSLHQPRPISGLSGRTGGQSAQPPYSHNRRRATRYHDSADSSPALSCSSYESLRPYPAPVQSRRELHSSSPLRRSRTPSSDAPYTRNWVTKNQTSGRVRGRVASAMLSSDEEGRGAPNSGRLKPPSGRRTENSQKKQQSPIALNECRSRPARVVTSRHVNNSNLSDFDSDQSPPVATGRSRHRVRTESDKNCLPTRERDCELDEIDKRLNVLQGFFQKYLTDS